MQIELGFHLKFHFTATLYLVWKVSTVHLLNASKLVGKIILSRESA